MNINRRDFFKISSLGVMSLYLNACSGLLFKHHADSKGTVLLPCLDKGVLRFYDWDTGTAGEANIPLRYTHSALQGVENKNDIFLFEQYGQSCAVFDFDAKRVKKVIHLPPEEVFYGHGVMSKNGKYLITTEYLAASSDESSGYLAVRDPSTLEKIYEIPSFGFRPHDICFLDSDTIAVTNHGEKEILSNISFISFSQKKLINKIKIERTWGEMGHIIPVSKEEVFVSSVLPEIPRSKEVDLLEKLAEENSEKGTEARVKLRNMVQWLPAPMYRVQKNGSFKRLWLEQEKNLFKNNFSICAISRENEIYASAHSRSHNMIIWKKWQPYKIIRFNDTWHPAAVACSNDGAELMAASSGGTVKFFSTENYEEIKEKALDLGSGPVHILSLK